MNKNSRLLVANRAAKSSPAAASLEIQERSSSVMTNTVRDLCNEYIEHLRSRGARSTRRVSDLFKRYLHSVSWAGTAAAELTVNQMTDLLKDLVAENRPTSASRLQIYLHAAYELARRSEFDPVIPVNFQRFGVSTNPISKVAVVARWEYLRRERCSLSRLELGYLWRELNNSQHDRSVAVRAIRLNLFLGGQRLARLCRCRISDLDLTNATLAIFEPNCYRCLPPLRHLLPLTSSALAEVLALREMTQHAPNPYLFSSEIEQPIAPARISFVFKALCRDLIAQERLPAELCFADVRTTIQANMEAAGISKSMCALIQFKDPMMSLEQGNLCRENFTSQQLEVLETWSQYLTNAAALADSVDDVASTDPSNPKK